MSLPMCPNVMDTHCTVSDIWLNVQVVTHTVIYIHIGLVVRMSILDTEVDGSNLSISMFSP